MVDSSPASPQQPAPTPVVPEQPWVSPLPAPVAASSNMWDAFQHILLFITLYTSATSLALILHYFVDLWLPPIMINNSSYQGMKYFQSMLLRGYLSSLIVSYPIFSFLFLKITKKTIENPHMRSLKSRKFLIYFTLVVTFIIALANIISIIYNLLGGNVTFNFLLHFLITMTISGAIFTYYIYQIKEDRIKNA